jgi:carbon monoxide dehydrogenase subunit G
LADKVDDWQATSDTCSFKAQGFTVNLSIVEREPDKLVKIEGDEGNPLEFTLWIQLKEVEMADTRMRIVLSMKLNMMMKMMLGSKIQSALDNIAEKMAEAFNNAPFPAQA